MQYVYYSSPINGILYASGILIFSNTNTSKERLPNDRKSRSIFFLKKSKLETHCGGGPFFLEKLEGD